MTTAEIKRMKELVRKVKDAGGWLCVLTPDESLELERLLRKKIGGLEFGFQICGEDQLTGI